MHKAFVIGGQKDGKEIHGILFTNMQLDSDSITQIGAISQMGIENITVSQARPRSAEPYEPAFYLFSSNVNEVEVINFDWCHKETGRKKDSGAPYEIIPPVSGEAAEKTLYAVRAHLIKGTMGGGTPVVGLLLIKPKPGQKALDPNPKVLKKMGVTVRTFESVRCESNGITENTLYLVERSPAANSVTIKTLANDGEVNSEREVQGDPKQLLPSISGSAADSLSKTGLFTPTMPPPERTSSIPAPLSSRPPISNRKRRRRAR
jgi:hypothetical protein